jgi:hypothetical protein
MHRSGREPVSVESSLEMPYFHGELHYVMDHSLAVRLPGAGIGAGAAGR